MSTNDRYEAMYEAARRHYMEGDTMEAIARDMRISRSSVSRLLTAARTEGIVSISLAEHRGSRGPMAMKLAQAFGVRVHVASVGDRSTPGARLDAVGEKSADLLDSLVTDDMRLGIAWGVTVTQVARNLRRHPLKGARVCQMNGGVNAWPAGVPLSGSLLQLFADALTATVVPFPVPAFFDQASTREAMWTERSIRACLDERAKLDVAIFGVGSMKGRVPSHVYTAGYLTPEDLAHAQAQGAIGDVCTVLLREDGTYADLSLNARATGPTPAELQRIPRRLCVCGDPSRARVVMGALRAGVATDLVCDDVTLRALTGLM